MSERYEETSKAETREPEQEMRRLTRRGLIWAGISVLGGGAALEYLNRAPEQNGLGWPFRRALRVNEGVWGGLFRNTSHAPTFDPSQRTPARVNGHYGLGAGFDPAKWTLRVENVRGSTSPIVLTLIDIKALPRREFTAQFCCIEGWNYVVTWAGASFRDFAAKYMPPARPGKSQSPDLDDLSSLARYVYMETPDRGYYVGLDMQSALHPQTLLCYEMNGEPLALEHGAPLRLAIPVKYGVKNLKRIGLIRYMDEPPADYWAERGYDWFAGL